MRIVRKALCKPCQQKVAHEGHHHGNSGIFHSEWRLCYKVSEDGKTLEVDVKGLDNNHLGNEIKAILGKLIPKVDFPVTLILDESGAHGHSFPPGGGTPPPPDADQEGVASYEEQERMIREQEEEQSYEPPTFIQENVKS